MLSVEEKRAKATARHKAWRAANPERWKETQRASRERTIDAVRARGRANAKRDRVKRYATTNAWREAHRDFINASRREQWGPEQQQKSREGHLRKAYGLTLEAYDSMLAEQGGKCAICPATPGRGRWGKLVVDHDHTTGQVRALLCDNCNCGIGFFGDDAERAQRAVDYLRRHSKRSEVA